MTDATDRPAEGPEIPDDLVAQIQVRQVTAGANELYEGIAKWLPSDQEAAVAASIKLPTPAKIGQAFHDKIMPRVKDGICYKGKYCSRKAQYDTGAAITSLAAKYTAEALTAALGVTIPLVGEGAALLVDTTALVLKNGLNKLCECPG